MRSQNDLVFDATIDGTGSYYSDPGLEDRLGSADKLTLFAVADGVGGTSPTLSVQLEESGNQRNWSNKAGAAEIPATSISATATTALVGYDTGATPSSGFVRAKITLGGGTPRAHVRLWVTGRGEMASPLSAGKSCGDCSSGRVGTSYGQTAQGLPALVQPTSGTTAQVQGSSGAGVAFQPSDRTTLLG